MRWLRRAGLFAAATALGCNAIFGIRGGELKDSDGGLGGGAVAGMKRFEGAAFLFAEGPKRIQSTLTTPFYVDIFEVTVAEFGVWEGNGKPPPAAGSKLDAGGPYDATMIWQSGWDVHVSVTAYKDGGCSPANGTADTKTTFGGDGSFPMSCVNWYQAAAYCYSVGKRLLTETEWEYIASSNDTTTHVYPWGDAAPTCDLATYADPASPFCGFPVPVGSAKGGVTEAGIHDLAGSVFEWVWDTYAPYPDASLTDYTGPTNEGDRGTRGGSFASPIHTLNTTDRDSTTPTLTFADIGIRCARSAL